MNTETTPETLEAAEQDESKAWDDNYEMMHLHDTIMFVRLALERLEASTPVAADLQEALKDGLFSCWNVAGDLVQEYSQAWKAAKAAVAALEEEMKA